MSRTKLTTRNLESIPPKEKRYNVFDADVRHLGIVIHPKGKNGCSARTWFHLAKVCGVPRRTTIGPWPDVSLELARAKAQELNAAIAKWTLNDFAGPSPVDKKPGEPTFGELLAGYIERHLKQNSRKPEIAAARAGWMRDAYLASWKNRKVSSIHSKTVKDLHGEIGARLNRDGKPCRHTANRIVQLVRAAFFWGKQSEMWSGAENPASKIKLFREPKRDRFLNKDELARLFAALKTEPNPDVADFVLLSLWCGARKADTLSMEWEHILPLKDNCWHVPATTKSGAPYTIALADEAVSILQNRLKRRTVNERWVFPSWGASGHITDFKARWKELVKRAGLENLRQHDLRRTLGSWQAQQGSSLTVIGKSLGHQSLSATAVYAQLELANVRQSVTSAVAGMAAAMKRKPRQAAAARG
jgi:integrase